MSERAEAWRDVGEAVGLATWGASTALGIALAVVLLNHGSTLWLGLLMLVTLLAPLCATAALVLTRNNWLAVALRYVLGVLLMRGTAGLRFRCLARWKVAQTAVAWLGLAGVGLVGALVAIYLATCYSVTALLSVPLLDATLVLSSVPALRRHILRPDLVFLESYRQTRYAAIAVLQSLPAAAIAATLLAAHVAGARYGAAALPQVSGVGSPGALQASQHGPGRALLADYASGESAYLRRLQQAGPAGVAQPSAGGPTPVVGGIAVPVLPGAPAVAPVQPPRQGLDLAGLLVAAAQALAASTLRVGGQQEQIQPQLQLTPLYAPGPTQQPEPSSQLAAAIIAQAQQAGSALGSQGAPNSPVNGSVGALGAVSWGGISAAVASTVPRWLLVLVLLASLANLATLTSLLVVACRAAGLPLLRHLPHIARMRGGLRVLGPVAEEALAVMAGPDRDTEPSCSEGACGDDDCSSDDGAGGGGGEDKGLSSGLPHLGAHCPGSTCGLTGRRLLISSAWHWGCPPEGPGPWLPLVPRYLLPTDAGWLGPGQMARLATLAFRFYGEGPERPGGTPGPAPQGDSVPAGSCSGPTDGGPAVTALEVEHLGGAELGVVVPRGLAVLPHVKRLHLRWCELHGRTLGPLLAALSAHPSLTDLTLERCQVDEATARLFQQLVAPAPGVAPCARLRALRLVRCSLSVPAASALADAVARAQGLRTFVFSGASIEPTGSRTIVAAAFARALRRAEGSLRHLTVGFSRGCPATAEALAAVVSECAAPQGLRHVVLSRREVASRGLAAWAAALARISGGGQVDTGPGAASRALTLRAVALGPNGASPGRPLPAMLRPSSIAAQQSGRDGGAPLVDGVAGDSTTQSAVRQPRRPWNGGRSAGEPVQWVLAAQELPITLVVDADPDAALRGRWLDSLSRRLLQHSTGGSGTAQQQAGQGWDTAPQRDTRLMSSAATVRESKARAPPAASVQHGSGFMGGGLLAPGSSFGAPPPAVAPAAAEPPGVGSSSGTAAPGDASSGLPPSAPRLVVLGSSDASDTVVCALKGLPLTTLDLAGLELGQRGSKLVAAALPQSGALRAVDLSATGMGDDAAVALASALAQCHRLETLMLESNCITDRGAQALAEALEAGACPALCQLSLGGNRFPLEWGTLLRLRNLASLRSGMWVQLLCPVAEAGRTAQWLAGKRSGTSVAGPSAPVEAAASSSRAGVSLASSPTVLSRLLSSQRTGKLWRRMSRRRARGDAEGAGGAAAATATTTGSSSDSSKGGSTDDSTSAGSEELCGVCFDRPNNLHVVGCGHQLCIPCYRRVVAPPGTGVASAGAGPTCPFCRGRIDGFVYADAIHRAVAEHLGVAGAVGGVCASSTAAGS